LIQHLAHRGARKFVLVSKLNNKPQSGFKTLTLRRLKNKNVTVVLSFSDPSTVRGAEDVLREAIALGTVSGIYHITTVSTFCIYFTTAENITIIKHVSCTWTGSGNQILAIAERKRFRSDEKSRVRSSCQSGHTEQEVGSQSWIVRCARSGCRVTWSQSQVQLRFCECGRDQDLWSPQNF